MVLDDEIANNDGSSVQIHRFSAIGIALSSEKDLDTLLEMILAEAMYFAVADGGTLYILNDDHLEFKIIHNESLNIKLGGTSGNPITFPHVKLEKSNVSAYSALTGESVNIPNVYETKTFDFTGPKNFDKNTGYRTKSMLVIPMENQDSEIIGVLQLVNAKDNNGETITFSEPNERLTRSLASMAAVAITNACLIQSQENLFDSYVEVMSSAIDERSPYTGGHIRRVAELAILMCNIINEVNEGPYADLYFTEEQIKEMSMAAWMHDVGKITSPMHIMDKAKKLETIFDRIHLIRKRFYLIEALEKNLWLEKKIAMLEANASKDDIVQEEEKHRQKVAELCDDLEFLVHANTGVEFMDDEKVERVREIGARTFIHAGMTKNYLTDDEIKNLTIRRGTLLEEERKKMQEHASVSKKILDRIPFTKRLRNVPHFAGAHHEFLDGSGYPRGLKGDEIPLEARILCLVDLYEALTASDRPYKKPLPIDTVYSILNSEAEKNKLDKDLLEFFYQQKVHEKFCNLTKEKK